MSKGTKSKKKIKGDAVSKEKCDQAEPQVGDEGLSLLPEVVEFIKPLVDPGIDKLPELPCLKKVYDSAGKEKYLELCRNLNLVPVSYFLRYCDTTHLNLSHRNLGVVGSQVICEALKTNPYVTKLDLTDNWMGPPGLGYIAELLDVSIITELNLSQNNLGSTGAKLIGDILYENPQNLKKLNISHNNFQDSDAVYIGAGLDGNDRLLEIDLSHNNFGVSAGKIFSAQVANTLLEKVDLSWNCIRGYGAIAIASALKITTIQYLNLGWNGFGDEAASILGRSLLVNSTLQFLDLTNNRIGLNGAQSIAKAFEKNDSLLTLKLGRNPIPHEGTLSLIKVLIPNPEKPAPPVSAIQILDLKDVRVSVEFDEMYKELKKIRNIEINYICDDPCHVRVIALKTRRETSDAERFKRIKKIEMDYDMKLYTILERLEDDVISAIVFRTYLEQIWKLPKVISDELATCLSMDGNIYKDEILVQFELAPSPQIGSVGS